MPVTDATVDLVTALESSTAFAVVVVLAPLATVGESARRRANIEMVTGSIRFMDDYLAVVLFPVK